MDGGFFKGTSTEQDQRFKDKEAMLLKKMKFPASFDQKVDMNKVEVSVLKPWITRKVTELLGFEDDVLIEYIHSLLEDESNKVLDAKKMQLNLTGFMEKQTPVFMNQLWNMLLSAQANPLKVPTELLEEKKREMREREQQQAVEKRKEEAIQEIRQRERGQRAQQDRPGRDDRPPQSFRGGHGPGGSGSGGGRGRGRGRGRGGYGNDDRGYYRGRSRSRSPPGRGRRHYSRSPTPKGRSYSRSRSRSRSPIRSRSPPRRRGNRDRNSMSRSRSRSRSPAPRRRSYSRSPSPAGPSRRRYRSRTRSRSPPPRPRSRRSPSPDRRGEPSNVRREHELREEMHSRRQSGRESEQQGISVRGAASSPRR